MGIRTILKNQANVNRGYFLELLAAHSNKLACSLLSNPGLRIDGGSGSAVAEAQNAFHAIVADVIVAKDAGQNMPALVGTVPNTEFGIFVWEMNAAGTITQLPVATGATLADIVFPTLSDDRVCLGALLVNPTGTGDFVGGTTTIDNATVDPNPVFFSGSNFGSLSNRVEFRETGAPISFR